MAKSPFKNVVRSLPMHNFNENPKLICLYKGIETLGDEENLDKDGNPKIFDVMFCTDLDTGEEIHCPLPYLIEKAVKSATANKTVFEIIFLGKDEVKGQPFNRFNINSCTVDEYEKFLDNVIENKSPKK